MFKQLALSLALLLTIAASTYAQYPWTPAQPTWPVYGPYIPPTIYPAPYYPVQVYIVDDFAAGGYYFDRPIYRRPRRW